EPVPRSLVGSPAGEVFALLVRMNDGAFHAQHRPAVDAAASRFAPDHVEAATVTAVRDLAARTSPNELISRIPVQAMARLLEVPSSELDATVEAVEDFVAGIAPGASTEAIA